MWFSELESQVYAACTYTEKHKAGEDYQGIIEAVCVELKKNGKGRMLHRLCELEKKISCGSKAQVYNEIREALRQIVSDIRSMIPGEDLSQSLVLALSGSPIGAGQDVVEWILTQELKVRKVVMIPEDRAKILADRRPVFLKLMDKEFSRGKQRGNRRVFYGILLAAAADENKNPFLIAERYKASPVYKREIQRAKRYITRYTAKWLYQNYSKALSFGGKLSMEEMQFDEVSYIPYFLKCRERFLRGLWNQVEMPELKCKNTIESALYREYQKRCGSFFIVDRFGGGDFSEFAAFTAGKAMEKAAAWSGNAGENLASQRRGQTLSGRLSRWKLRMKVKAAFRYWAVLYIRRIWDQYFESEEFNVELLEAAQIADDVFYSRF